MGGYSFIMDSGDEAAVKLLTEWIDKGILTYARGNQVVREFVKEKDINSAFSTENFRKAITLAIKINQKRIVSDDVVALPNTTDKSVKVTDFHMAFSGLSSNISVRVEAHSRMYLKMRYTDKNSQLDIYRLKGAENLTLGSDFKHPEDDKTNAIKAWYDAEKIVYNRLYRGQDVDMEELRQKDETLWRYVRIVGDEIGHYMTFGKSTSYLGTGFNSFQTRSGSRTYSNVMNLHQTEMPKAEMPKTETSKTEMPKAEDREQGRQSELAKPHDNEHGKQSDKTLPHTGQKDSLFIEITGALVSILGVFGIRKKSKSQ